jgi:uncharacterized phiE125 gp8 family phage protein
MSVPLSTIKSALKIDYADDDSDLIRLREAAMSLVERKTELTLTPQAKTLYLASFANTLLPAYPFNSLTSVTYYDSSNTLTTMPSGDYWIDRTDGPMVRIRFLEAPSIYEGTAISVNYNAGYSAVPNEIVHVVIALVGAWYNNPEAFQPISLTTVPMSVQYILDSVSTGSRLR